MEESIFVDEEL
jgi:hypothetical protein